MINKITVCLVLFCVLICCVERSIAQPTVYYTWKGGAGCVEGQATPCDFDNGDFWTVGSYTKRDSEELLGEPASPASQTKLYNIVFPTSFSNANYKIQSNTPTYNIYNIFMNDQQKKKSTESILGGGGGQGMTLIFKDTSLPKLNGYTVGGFVNYYQTLIFDNVQINATTSTYASSQLGYSTVKLTGKTSAKFSSALSFSSNDTFILDTDATLEMVGNYNPPVANINYGRFQNLEIYGTLLLPTTEINWDYYDAQGTATATFTGANITYPNYQLNNYIEMNARAYIGKNSNDNGKITYINAPVGLSNRNASLNIGAKTESYVGIFYLVTYAQVIVQEESILHVIKTQHSSSYGSTYYHLQDADMIVKGNSQVFIDRETRIFNDKKRNVEGSPVYFHNFTIYDGLLQFNDIVDITSGGTYFITKNNSSKLTFNGNINDHNYNPVFEFASGSTISFNAAYQFAIELPINGINYEFGNHNYTKPNPPQMAVADGGSIKLKGSKLNGYGTINIEDSEFGGYGYVDGNVTLSVSSGKTRATSEVNHAGHNHPKLSLSYIGKTLEITGKLTIPSSSVISVTADSTSCGKLTVGELDISSSVSFGLVFVGQPPTQNKTYIVAEYTTFAGTLPSSPNVQVYQVENDTQNKQIKVHYTYIPPPPTEPVTPNTPTNTPPTTGPSNSPTATASSSQFSTLIFLLVLTLFALF